MVGLFLSNFAVNKALGYWELMFPVFGVACVWHELAGGAAYVKPLWRILLRQTFHWLFPIVAVRVLFLQHARGEMSADSVALVVLVLLALTCFLAGIHFDNSCVGQPGPCCSRDCGDRGRDLSLAHCGSWGGRSGAGSDFERVAAQTRGRRERSVWLTSRRPDLNQCGAKNTCWSNGVVPQD